MRLGRTEYEAIDPKIREKIKDIFLKIKKDYPNGFLWKINVTYNNYRDAVGLLEHIGWSRGNRFRLTIFRSKNYSPGIVPEKSSILNKWEHPLYEIKDILLQFERYNEYNLIEEWDKQSECDD